MSQDLLFASYPVFGSLPERLERADRDVVAKEVAELVESFSGRVSMRGAYSTVGFRADADAMFWWVAANPDDLQSLYAELRRTELGRALEPRALFVGLVRPAEFATDHLPAFVRGVPPARYVCVYPFVRTPEWYLLEPAERGALLREHGDAGRLYPDVHANTTSAFGLGDFEWILAFEADGLDRIVDLIRRLRATEARRFTKLETPFYTGVRKDLRAVIADLP
jgi:chlorite dismutase